jgi:hypothetical protein
MKIVKLNDLYFPKGNENGDYYEPYYQAIDDQGNIAYSSSPAQAAANLKEKTEK